MYPANSLLYQYVVPTTHHYRRSYSRGLLGPTVPDVNCDVSAPQGEHRFLEALETRTQVEHDFAS
jgi:hypothetical protein